MQHLNPQERLSFLKDTFCVIPHGEDKGSTRLLAIGRHTNKDLEEGVLGRINTWLNGSSSHMKKVDSKTEVSLDYKSSSHFSFSFEFKPEMDKDILQALASALGVTMQRLFKIRLYQLYEETDLSTICLKNLFLNSRRVFKQLLMSFKKNM